MKYRVMVCYFNWGTEEHFFYNKSTAFEYSKQQLKCDNIKFITILRHNGTIWDSIKFWSWLDR